LGYRAFSPYPYRLSRDPEAVSRRTNVGGCLLRFVLLVVFLFIALVIAPFLFGGFLFGIY
jgi:hypothetical protein